MDHTNTAALIAVIAILALAFLVACSFAWLYRGEAAYWRHRSAEWRSRANGYRRGAVAFKRSA